ncbi:MAG: Ig-like domain-containing protein, partial [Actinomycetota bacterium]
EIVVVDNDSDPEGDLDPGSVIVVRPPAHGAVICADGTCTYTPEPGYTGEDDFDYRVCDTFGACTTGTVTIEIPGPVPTPSPTPSATPAEPGGSIGEGGSSGGGGNGHSGGASGPDRPDRDGQPSRPGDGGGDDAGIDPVPLTGLNPILGAPGNPAMPMTGGEPGFYLALALNLVLAGGLLLFLDARSRRTAPVALPELLSGGIDHSEPQPEIVLQRAEPHQPETPKPVAKKPAAAKSPAPKKATTAKASTAKKTSTKKAASTKKSTVAKPAAKRASTSNKTTARATSSKKSTVAKKSTVRKTTVRKSAAAS